MQKESLLNNHRKIRLTALPRNDFQSVEENTIQETRGLLHSHRPLRPGSKKLATRNLCSRHFHPM